MKVIVFGTKSYIAPYLLQYISSLDCEVVLYDDTTRNWGGNLAIEKVFDHQKFLSTLSYDTKIINLCMDQYEFSRLLASIAKGVCSFVQLSDLRANPLSIDKKFVKMSHMEVDIRYANPEATIVRPSILFSKSVVFRKTLVRMANFFPFICIVGNAMIKPVFISDVAKALLSANPSCTYDLLGPELMSAKQMIAAFLKSLNKMLPVFCLPLWMKNFWFKDMIFDIDADKGSYQGFAELNIVPTSWQTVFD